MIFKVPSNPYHSVILWSLLARAEPLGGIVPPALL